MLQSFYQFYQCCINGLIESISNNKNDERNKRMQQFLYWFDSKWIYIQSSSKQPELKRISLNQ